MSCFENCTQRGEGEKGRNANSRKKQAVPLTQENKSILSDHLPSMEWSQGNSYLMMTLCLVLAVVISSSNRGAKGSCIRVVEITKKVILDQDQVQAIYFDLRSDQGQIF